MVYSIIVPTYNERLNVALIVFLIFKHLPDVNFKIIIVDDGSPDRTQDIVKQLQQVYGEDRVWKDDSYTEYLMNGDIILNSNLVTGQDLGKISEISAKNSKGTSNYLVVVLLVNQEFGQIGVTLHP